LIVTSRMCAFLGASTTWPTFQLLGLLAVSNWAHIDFMIRINSIDRTVPGDFPE